jgi:hypothetical protein
MRSLSPVWALTGGLLITLLSTAPALACEPIYRPASSVPVGCKGLVGTADDRAFVAVDRLALASERQPGQLERARTTGMAEEGRPAALPPLYVSFAAMQVLDAHSTLSAARDGAVERNPLVAPLIERPMAVVAVKAATTVGAIWLTEKLWRRHRVAAIALMIGINGAYAAIVANNYRVRR